MDWSFGEFLWAMFVFYLWLIVIWMFISIFTDIFRREDLSGWGKAGWVFLIVVLPFLGILIYVIVRPKPTVAERQMFMSASRYDQQGGGHSAAEEIERLAKLKDEGKISAEEYEKLKQRALA